MIFYVNKPEERKGDPEQGMDIYNKAISYRSFVAGSVEAPLEEFSYLPGLVVVERRGYR